MIGHELLGADRHIDTECPAFSAEQLGVTRVIGGADSCDARGVFVEQGRDDLARDHVDLIAVRERDDDAGFARGAGIERAGVGCVAYDRTNIEPILQIAQRLVIHIDDRYLVRLFACEVVCSRSPDLASTEDDDSHVGLWALAAGRWLEEGPGSPLLPHARGPEPSARLPAFIPAPSWRTPPSAIWCPGSRS